MISNKHVHEGGVRRDGKGRFVKDLSPERVKALLVKHKCNRNAVAAEMGVNRKTVYRIILDNPHLQDLIDAEETWEKALYERTQTKRNWSVRNNNVKSRAYCLVGTYYEQLFNVRAIEAGLHPHQPLGDYLPHDMVIMSPTNRLYRVQIKGTNTPKQGGSYRIRTTTDTPKNYDHVNRRRYIPLNKDHCDVVACYVEQLDTWYLVPVACVSSAAMTFFPTNPNSCGKYEKYLNNWRVFK